MNEKKTVTEQNDVWVLGNHRLICGDCTSKEVVDKLFRKDKCDLLFTSPPYDNQRVYKVGSIKWTDLMKGMTEVIPSNENTQVLINLGLIHRNYEWQPYWQEWLDWIRTPEGGSWRRFGWYIWDQGSGLPGDWNGRLAPCFEFVFHFNHNPRTPNKIIPCVSAGKAVPLDKRGGLRQKSGTDAAHWTHAGKPVQDMRIPDALIRVQREATSGIQREHPAVFPIKFPEFVIKTYSNENEIVYEPFSGSGTVILASENTNRKCYAVELAPEYVDVTIRRFHKMFPSGDKAILETSGESFFAVAKRKNIELPDDNEFRELTGTKKLDYQPSATLESFM